MKVMEAIERIDGLKPNALGPEMKIIWLYEADVRLWDEIMRGSECAPERPEEYGRESELLLSVPDEEIYLAFLAAKIDFWNAEYARYNNDMLYFNALRDDFAARWNRDHRVKKNMPFRV